jgi:dihydroneopterin aldolase
MADTVEIRGLRAMGIHGVRDFEKVREQLFVVDLILQVDLRKAAAADDLYETVSYSDVMKVAIAIIEGEHVDLVETLAERMATALLKMDKVDAVDITVRKPNALVAGQVTDVGVRIQRP